jgi:hypothetical protein
MIPIVKIDELAKDKRQNKQLKLGLVTRHCGV